MSIANGVNAVGPAACCHTRWSIPRLSSYHCANFLGSRLRKNSPPMPSTRSVGVFICTSTVSGVPLSAVLTAAKVAAPIITDLRSISMSWYMHYDAATGLPIISAKAMSDSYEKGRRSPTDRPLLGGQRHLPPTSSYISASGPGADGRERLVSGAPPATRDAG